MIILLPCGWRLLPRAQWIPTLLTFSRSGPSHSMHLDSLQQTLVSNAFSIQTILIPLFLAYLCNVLAALGQPASSTLSQMEVLFKAEEEE